MSFWRTVLLLLLPFAIAKLSDFAINVISNIATPSIRKASKHIYLILTTKLIKVGQAFNQGISRTYSLVSAKLNIDYFVERAVEGISFLVIGVLRVAVVCFWLFLINYQLNRIFGHVGDVRPNAFAASQVGTCYCPTPTNSIPTRSTLQPSYLPHDCPQPYDIRQQYPAQSVLFTTENPVFDCAPPRKGRKSKRLIQPCSVEISVPSTDGGYALSAADDSPR